MPVKATKPGTLWTIGYQGLAFPTVLVGVVQATGATLWDVRSRPSGRVRRGYDRASLAALLGPSYEWHGDKLGGLDGGWTDAGLALLRRHLDAGESILLMCAEEMPMDCHRHGVALALPKRYGRWHIIVSANETVEAGALERATLDGVDYDCYDWPPSWLNSADEEK